MAERLERVSLRGLMLRGVGWHHWGLAAILMLIGTSVASAQDSITVGGIFDLSSAPGAKWGRAEKNAFVMALEEFHRQNPALRVSDLVEDSGYDNVKSVSAIQKLSAINNVRFFVGPTWEPFSAVIPLCEQRKLICIAPSSNNTAFDDARLRYSFTVWFEERDYGRALTREFNKLSSDKVALVTGTSAYYESVAEAVRQSLNSKPIFFESTAPTEQDFRSMITRMPASIDALFVFLLGDGPAQAFFRQWVTLRRDRPQIYTDDALLYYTPPLDLSALGFKVRYSEPDLQLKFARDFSTSYQKKFNEEVGAPSAAGTYDATMILLECMKKHAARTEEVRSCIAATSHYNGVSGVLSFEGGQRVKGRAMVVRDLK